MTLLTILLISAMNGGCWWWWSSEPEANKKPAEEKKKAEPLPDIQATPLANRPAITYPRQVGDSQPLTFKPGHQMPAVFALRANRDDYRGTLSWQLGDPGGRPLSPTPLVRSLDYSRPATLPKQQWRQFEISFLSPAAGPFRLAPQLRSAGLGPGFDLTSPVVRSMPLQMYELLVLAADPLDYRGLANLNMVEFSSQSIDENDSGTANPAHYAVVFPTKENASLPRGMLHWTTFAFVVWDDYDPAKLAPDEQAALLDWLHWGGQLILSGPDTLTTLADSFLKPYLPATAGESLTLDREQLAFLDQRRGATRVKRCKSSSRGQASNWCRMQQRNGCSIRRISSNVAWDEVVWWPRRFGSTSASYASGRATMAFGTHVCCVERRDGLNRAEPTSKNCESSGRKGSHKTRR